MLKLLKQGIIFWVFSQPCNCRKCVPDKSHDQEQETPLFFNYCLLLVSKHKLPLYQINGILHLNTKVPSTLQRIFIF